MKGKQIEPKPGKRQNYYLEIKGYPGRVDVHYFEFGRHFAVEGSASLRQFSSPILIRASPGYRGSPLYTVISTYYARNRATNGGMSTEAAILPECMIGVETKENGRVSYDIILKLKQCAVIDHMPDEKTSGWIKISFFDAEKTWVTW